MLRLKEIILNHKSAVILALLTSFIVAFPQVFFRIEHRDGGIYQGIELLPDSPWSARIAEVQNGHPLSGSIYYKDGKDNPYLFQPLGSMVVGYMGRLFLLDINNTLLLSRFVLPFAVFLLMYAFVYLLSRDKLVALSSAAVLLLADSALSYFGLTSLLQGISPEDFIRLARPLNPAMIYVFFFGFLVAFWLFYKNRDWRYGIASAILLGLNFYNYFYSWTYLYAFGGILVLSLLIRKQWREAVRIFWVFFGALLVAIPYAINLYRASLHPAYEEAGLRFGVVETHAPLFVGFMVIGALVIFLWKFPKEDQERYFFSLALLVAPFVALNQQLITGKVLQPAHYHWFFHKPMAVIFIFMIIFYMFAQKGWVFHRKALATLILAGSLATAVFVQATSYYDGTNDGGKIAIDRQKYGPVMTWLSEHAEKEAVVLANNEISHMTVIYTPQNVYYHRAAMYSLAATKERLLEVIFTFYRLRGIEPNKVRDVFFAERAYLSANIYGMHYRELFGSYEAIPDEKIEEIVTRYEETSQVLVSKWLNDILAKYEVEYVIWDKQKELGWNLDQYAFLKKAVEFGDLAIYRRK